MALHFQQQLKLLALSALMPEVTEPRLLQHLQSEGLASTPGEQKAVSHDNFCSAYSRRLVAEILVSVIHMYCKFAM